MKDIRKREFVMVNWKTVVFSSYQILIYKRNHGKKRVRQAIKNKEPTNENLVSKTTNTIRSHVGHNSFPKTVKCSVASKTENRKHRDQIAEERCFTIEMPFSKSVSKTAPNVIRQEVPRSPWKS